MKHAPIPILLALAAGLVTAGAQQKVSQRTALPAGSVAPATDILPIVDISAGSGGSKKITIDDLFTGWGFTAAGKTLATAADAAAQRTALGTIGATDTVTLTNKTLGSGTAITLGSDAAGDLYYRASGGALTRLGVGTDGHVLTLASGLPVWAAGGMGSGDLLSTNNLSDLANVATARTNLGLAIGTDVQAYDADLDAWAAKTAPTGTAVGTSDTQNLTNKTLGTGTTITLGSDAAGDIYYRASGGALTRLAVGTDGQFLTLASGLPAWGAAGAGSGDLLSTNNLSDLANVATARTNLGLAIGTNVQAYDADLDAWAGKTAPTGTAVGTSDTQTLTNKTLGTGTSVTLGSDAAGDIYYRASGGELTRLGVGTDGQVLTLASGLPSWAAGGGGGGLTNWTEAVSTAAPNATVPVVSFTATNAATNVDAAVIAKGTGAILAQIPTGSSSGGNKRGDYAVDFSRYNRNAATQVASGLASFIGSGTRNTASNTYSAVVAGQLCVASGTQSFIGGGSNNQATGDYATVPAGINNTASGNSSAALGSDNAASGENSVAMGRYASTRGLYGMRAHGATRFASTGDAQKGEYILRRATTDATATELTLDGGVGAAATRMVLPNNHAYKFRGQLIARDIAAGDVKSWDISGTIKRGANAAATAIVGTATVTVKDEDAGATTWTVTVDADTTNGSLRIQGTGEAATTIRWVAEITTVEVG